MDKDYYVGLDIGTNSVGWAVTDPDYNLIKFHKKDMWGIRLFEEANTAADRRLKRTNRRRLKRRKQRIDLLQMLFAEEMYKVDPEFFIRLNESRLHIEDKSTGEKHVLFCDDDYSDVDYYKEYPTIYHLRKELIENPKEHDIRLVYLALHHIMKSRGHFLINGTLSNVKEFSTTLQQFLEYFNDNMDYHIEVSDPDAMSSILKDHNVSKSDKAKELEGSITLTEEDAFDKDGLKVAKNAIKEICKLMVGNQGDLRKIFYTVEFDVDESLIKAKFSDQSYEEKLVPELEQSNPDEFAVLERIKTIYDWSLLIDILSGENYFSFAKVEAFKTHHDNLKKLHYLIKKYASSEEYKLFFESDKEKANYVNYTGQVKKGHKKLSGKWCAEEDFYKTLSKLLDKIRDKVEADDKTLFNAVYEGAESHRLLPLQRSKDNSVVPKQVHEEELNKILQNAENYLSFLKDKDESGYSVSEKIRLIFNYKIPYYIGPLSDRHKNEGSNTWAERKADGYIYPWNIEEKIDYEKSNENFITRMTNKCTYLPWCDVLPKNSLLYSKFMVLNELNNLTIQGKKLGDNIKLKRDIYHDLFEKHSKVKASMLLTYLQKDDPELSKDDLGGFDIDFKASLSSYMDFAKIFGERINEKHIQDICEDIVKWATIYNGDSKMLASVIKKNYGQELYEEQIKKASKLKYTGWGQLSRELLEDIQGVDTETGEVFSIIQGLWNTNNNLMQLLSSRFTFEKEIVRMNREKYGDITDISYDSLVKEQYTSPANKRAIWQSILIMEEIKKVMGHEPAKVFVEMARGGEKEKTRKNSRKQKLLDLYKACKEDASAANMMQEIESHDERDFNSMKLYLYYTQMGKCAYTGESIDLDALMSGNSLWDRDHIYPQSKIKDDSIDNLVLVKKVENAKKDNGLISSDIQKKMYPIWKAWLDQGLISKTKFAHLTRKDDFSVDELSGFVNRQLVETRQSTKIVADLLDRMYKNTKVVKVKAGLASDFRKAPLNVLKCRLINDFHHAKDAYLNIVVGNVYSVKFTDNPREWVKKHKDENWSINKVFYYDVEGAWTAPKQEKGNDGKPHAVRDENGDVITGTIDKVRKTVLQDNVLYTEYTYCAKGELFNATVQKKKAGLIPLKNELKTSEYGGYNSASTSYFALVEYDGKKGERVKQIIGVPIYIANRLGNNPNAFIDYCSQIKKMDNVKVLVPMIKKNALLRINGFPMRIRGENERDMQFKSNQQLILDRTEATTVRKIEKWIDKDTETIDLYHDGLEDCDLVKLYEVLLQKMSKGVYANRPANQAQIMNTKYSVFLSLTAANKARVLNELIGLFKCDTKTTANLKLMEGTTNCGSITINKNTVGKSRVTLINQSVTGLFETRYKL